MKQLDVDVSPPVSVTILNQSIDYLQDLTEQLSDISDQYSICYNKNWDDTMKQNHDDKYIFIFSSNACAVL